MNQTDFEEMAPPWLYPGCKTFHCNVPGIELRGLLKSCVKYIHAKKTTQVPFGCIEPVVQVTIMMRVPDRESNQLINIMVKNDVAPNKHLLDRNMTPEQAAVSQMLEFMWEHELHEGVVANGTPVWNPEVDHGP